MYTATQASMLHRWKLNLNTCKKCMLRYWKIPFLTSLNLERVISLFSPQISLRRNKWLFNTPEKCQIHAHLRKKVGMRSLKHTRAHTHSLPRHYDNDVIHVRKHNRTHAQRATRLWVELVLLPEFNGEAMLKSLQIGGVNPP